MSRVDPDVAAPVFVGKTANDAWSLALASFDGRSGQARVQPSRDGMTREVLHSTIAFGAPRQRWITSRMPAINPAFAIAESLWILWGRNDEALPGFFNQKFSKFNGAGPLYAGAYGHRLRATFGFDQLQRAVDALSGIRESRQVVLQIWNATEDFPESDGAPRRGDIPCNLLSMLKIRDNRLHWTQVLRSNDLILGTPYNIVQFSTLQEILAGWLGVELGPYVQICDSLHIYERDLVRSGALAVVVPEENVDNLALPMPESRQVLESLERAVGILIRDGISLTAFQAAMDLDNYPPAYANLLAIMGAEAARRHRWIDESNRLANACTNAALRQVWAAWFRRVSPRGAI